MNCQEFVVDAMIKDIYQTVKASRQFKDESVFRHTIYQDTNIMIFCALFPKDEILKFPDLNEDFTDRLKENNFLGVITDADQKLEVIWLGGTDKAFQKIASRKELKNILQESALVEYIEEVFLARAVKVKLSEVEDEKTAQDLIRVLFSE